MHNSVTRPAAVAVTVPARLHLGFLDLNGGLGRRFGGVGLAISELRTCITIRKAKVADGLTDAAADVSGPESNRARQYLQAMEQRLALGGSHQIRIADVVPAHVGLGSGTQLALAVAAGVRAIHGKALDVEGDAMALGRGARSGIGIGLFHHGGLVVDGGRGGDDGAPPPTISRLTFPESWRIIVVLDPQHRGMHGADEIATFAKLAPMSAAEAAHICRLILIKALPALAEYDIANFGVAIKELQARLGDYFAPAQGGSRFLSGDVAAVLETLDGAGAFGIGQSSWGPTGFAFAASAQDAHRLAAAAQQHPRGRRLDIRVCKGLNRGADIVVQARDSASLMSGPGRRS